jgi:hypothetical protein
MAGSTALKLKKNDDDVQYIGIVGILSFYLNDLSITHGLCIATVHIALRHP